jgi:hypothetical protein
VITFCRLSDAIWANPSWAYLEHPFYHNVVDERGIVTSELRVLTTRGVEEIQRERAAAAEKVMHPYACGVPCNDIVCTTVRQCVVCIAVMRAPSRHVFSKLLLRRSA